MASKRTVSAEVEKQVQAIESMTIEQVGKAITKCMTGLIAGRLTEKEGSLLNRAAGKRLKELSR